MRAGRRPPGVSGRPTGRARAPHGRLARASGEGSAARAPAARQDEGIGRAPDPSGVARTLGSAGRCGRWTPSASRAPAARRLVPVRRRRRRSAHVRAISGPTAAAFRWACAAWARLAGAGRAAFPLAGDDHGARHSALQRLAARVEAQQALLLLRPVAGDAVRLEDRTDVALEVRRRPLAGRGLGHAPAQHEERARRGARQRLKPRPHRLLRTPAD